MENGGLTGATLGLENLGELFVVVGHHGGLGHLLAGNHCTTYKTVNVLDTAESLLPEFELDGGLELKETSIEVTGEGIRVGKVDRVLLVTVFRSVAQILAKTLVTQATEICFALVGLAEGESLVGNLLTECQRGFRKEALHLTW